MMTIGLAQIKPEKGDIGANITMHLQCVQAAIGQCCDALFFPELSLTGYEPELVKDLAITEQDSRFDVFQQASDRGNISIGNGAPTLSGSGICISMIFFQPGKERQLYSKQHLHADELPYFTTGDRQLIFSVDKLQIAPAICYESLLPHHAEQAKSLGAELYIASVAKSQKGIDKAMSHFPVVASHHSMPVLLCNSVGFCDNFYSAGQSAVWSKTGKLLAKLDDHQEGLLVFNTDTEQIVIAGL